MRRFAFVIALTLTTAAVANADWNPQAFSTENTLEFLTTEDGVEHWSTVWLVVIDGQVYIRLGSRAAARIERQRHQARCEDPHRRADVRQGQGRPRTGHGRAGRQGDG